MSTGKYSPICPHANEPGWDVFKFNCYGELPAEYSKEHYDEKTMFDDYDDEGFDCYGYSAFDADGNYVGFCNGIDRAGYTEMDYLQASINGDDLHGDIRYTDILKSFPRKR